jgi:hypothetical protein
VKKEVELRFGGASGTVVVSTSLESASGRAFQAERRIFRSGSAVREEIPHPAEVRRVSG